MLFLMSFAKARARNQTCSLSQPYLIKEFTQKSLSLFSVFDKINKGHLYRRKEIYLALKVRSLILGANAYEKFDTKTVSLGLNN